VLALLSSAELDSAEDFIAQLYNRMYKKLYLAAYSRLRSFHAAEDITQDVFVLAQEKREELLVHPNPEGWLFDTLKNKIKHELRAKTRFFAMQGKLEAMWQTTRNSKIGFSQEMINCLTEKEHRLMRMIFVEGYSIREVAKKYGLIYDTCRRHVQAAKEKLNSMYNDD
jgi:RNA polymerase sigma-70 factor (ECF subfamily)